MTKIKDNRKCMIINNSLLITSMYKILKLMATSQKWHKFMLKQFYLLTNRVELDFHRHVCDKRMYISWLIPSTPNRLVIPHSPVLITIFVDQQYPIGFGVPWLRLPVTCLNNLNTWFPLCNCPFTWVSIASIFRWLFKMLMIGAVLGRMRRAWDWIRSTAKLTKFHYIYSTVQNSLNKMKNMTQILIN